MTKEILLKRQNLMRKEILSRRKMTKEILSMMVTATLFTKPSLFMRLKRRKSLRR